MDKNEESPVAMWVLLGAIGAAVKAASYGASQEPDSALELLARVNDASENMLVLADIAITENETGLFVHHDGESVNLKSGFLTSSAPKGEAESGSGIPGGMSTPPTATVSAFAGRADDPLGFGASLGEMVALLMRGSESLATLEMRALWYQSMILGLSIGLRHGLPPTSAALATIFGGTEILRASVAALAPQEKESFGILPMDLEDMEPNAPLTPFITDRTPEDIARGIRWLDEASMHIMNMTPLLTKRAIEDHGFFDAVETKH